ncbi:Metalloenzyme, LuxS/M16 peptidase-like protein [Cokeromyces recurvatus]|uniref:Metalloenzyme, LuxS/M16 peptidase-like protein n=1 Tax=Cokeromyces recurvatus TaxID=90255 RepID=UPI002221295B|nr:Metalloenzyme, LuxS/M16 peptidase-like protein [Cokeromyces recurvatus]KAI7901194.1 Metalloenzyme, LuxS/M16 peptidase-like protein [Cokeromyces recurvatus]
MVSTIVQDDINWQNKQFYFLYTKPLEKPDNDDREYRLIRLLNKLEVLLISDPDTDRASAALDVHVGSFSDPENLQGLAHFCEHLLFMGTRKYPKENDYYSYLFEHSGDANAFTGNENTNYFFEVGYQWLEGALDRFAHFFIDPLFSESCTERELRAVDSEHKKIFNRIVGTGNLETLMDRPKQLGLDIRQELLKFHNRYYSANIMKLVVLGRESLDQLTEWVVEKFSDVVNKNISVPSFPGHPLTNNELLKQVFIKPVKKCRILGINFPFPEQLPYYESQPLHYISHLTGHEGPGSVLSYLKKKNWATYLSSGIYINCIGFSLFHTSVELTEQGLIHYEDIVVAIFQYIKMIKEAGVKKWIFDEIKSLAEIDFKFSEKCPSSQYTSFLSEQMQENLPPQWVVSGHSLLRKYDPVLIEEHLKLLRTDNFRLTLTCQEFPNGIQPTKVEKWYLTEYETLPISEELLFKLSNMSMNNEFFLPKRNEFIPSNLNVDRFEVKEKEDQPEIIRDTSLTRIWYKKDDTFWVPKTNVWIFFKNPLPYATPRNAVISELYISLLTDSLSEYSYNAEIAGLSYFIHRESKGITLHLGGYSDKLLVLLNKVIDKMKNIQILVNRFEAIKDEITRVYENFYLEAPYQHSIYYMSYVFGERKWTCDDYLGEIKDISLKDVQQSIPEIISTLHIEGLVHGSLERTQALEMFQSVQSILQPRPLAPGQLMGERSIMLPQGKKFVYSLSVRDPDEVNSAINYHIQVCNVKDISLRNHLSLVAQIAREPCFNQLRTQEQLGYLVFSGVQRHLSQLAFRLIIQSEYNPIYLEHRALEFLEITLRNIIMEMSESDYESQVNSLISERLEKHKNISEEGVKYWAEIESGYYEFNDTQTDVAELKKITKESLLAFYDTYIMPNSPVNTTFSIHLRSQRSPLSVSKNSHCTVEQLYSIMVHLGLVDRKTLLSEDHLKNLIIDHGGNIASIAVTELETLLSSLELKKQDIEQIIVKLHEGPSALSKRDHTKLPKNYIVIHDLIDFKRRMCLSTAAVPINYQFFNV